MILKGWVKKALIIIQALLFFLLTGECATIGLELAIKIPTLILIYANHQILENYTDFYKKGF